MQNELEGQHNLLCLVICGCSNPVVSPGETQTKIPSLLQKLAVALLMGTVAVFEPVFN